MKTFANNAKQRWLSLAVTALSFAAGAWGLGRLQVSNDITHFLPHGGGSDAHRYAMQIVDTPLTRTWVLALRAGTPETSRQAARSMASLLERQKGLRFVHVGPPAGMREAATELYWPRRAYFLRGDPRQALSDASLDRSATRLRERLASPTGAFDRALAPEDPLLLFSEQIDTMARSAQGGLQVVDDVFQDERGTAYVFFATEVSAFSSTAHHALLQAIEAEHARLEQQLGSLISLEQSSFHRMAIDSERRIRGDIQRISVIGSVGVALFVLFVFGSPRSLLLLFLPMLCGIGWALAAASLAFDAVHGVTLTFGASLIGVCVDYALHLMAHQRFANAAPEAGRDREPPSVWPGIVLGATTTIAGLVGLGLTSFPGLRQVALLASVGVLGAVLATYFVVRPWLDEPPAAGRSVRLAQRIESAWSWIATRRVAVAVVAIVVVLGASAGITRLSWVDSLKELNQLDAQLLAEDAAVREAVARMDTSRFILSVGKDVEEALARNDRVHELMNDAKAAGELGGFRSLSTYLPSNATQQRSREALSSSELAPRLEAAYERAGFVPDAFSPFMLSLRTPHAALTREDLASSPFAQALEPFFVDLEGEVGVLTLLKGPVEAKAIDLRLGGIEGVFMIDQQALFTDAYRGYRLRSLEVIAIGLVVVLSLIALRYRRLRISLAAFLPALLAAAATLGLLGWLDLRANLMHLVALLLILSMGVDYGVFVVEQREHAHGRRASLFGIGAACMTSLLTFGLLALSTNPALRSLGVATSLGIALSLVLAPLALVLLDPQRKATR